MFTTANGFHLVLMIQPVNSPSTFLFRTTLSSWCISLTVSLTVLVMNPTYLIFSYHLFTSVSCPVSSSLPQERPPPSAIRRFWHFGATNWSDFRLYFSDFP